MIEKEVNGKIEEFAREFLETGNERGEVGPPNEVVRCKGSMSSWLIDRCRLPTA